MNLQYMLDGILDLLNRIDKNIIIREDKEFLEKSIKLFYITFLQNLSERILASYSSEDKRALDLRFIKGELDLRLGKSFSKG